MKETLNYKLKKIELTDSPPDITIQSGNFDIIDEELKNVHDKANGVGTDLATLQKEVNEHKAENATQHGDLTTLKTTEKTNFVGAINEVFTNVSNGKQLVGGAITDVDNSVVIPTNATFQDLATAIGQISTGKKWASGTVTGSNDITLSNLDFIPSKIIFYNTQLSDNLKYVTIIISKNRDMKEHTNAYPRYGVISWMDGSFNRHVAYIEDAYPANTSSDRVFVRFLTDKFQLCSLNGARDDESGIYTYLEITGIPLKWFAY